MNVSCPGENRTKGVQSEDEFNNSEGNEQVTRVRQTDKEEKKLLLL